MTTAQKTVDIPSFISSTGMDLNDNNSQWSYARSVETENVVIFWEPGFGPDPAQSPAPYKIDMKSLIEVSEKSFSIFLDSLQFAQKGASVTDRYKLMVFLLYTTYWAAFVSGQDDLVGSLFVSPAAPNIKHVVAHDIGYCLMDPSRSGWKNEHPTQCVSKIVPSFFNAQAHLDSVIENFVSRR